MTTYYIISAVVGVVLVLSIVALCIINEHKDKLKDLVYKLLRKTMVYVEEAEKSFGAGKGEAKLDYVLTKVELDMKNYNVKLPLVEIVDFIEQVLSTPNKKLNKNTTQPQVVRPNTITSQTNGIPNNQHQGV